MRRMHPLRPAARAPSKQELTQTKKRYPHIYLLFVIEKYSNYKLLTINYKLLTKVAPDGRIYKAPTVPSLLFVNN